MVRKVEVVLEPLLLLFLTGRHVMKTHCSGPLSVSQQGLTGNKREPSESGSLPLLPVCSRLATNINIISDAEKRSE